MATLQELLEGNFNDGAVKTAGVVDTQDDSMDGIDKLAMQLGLFGETEEEDVKVAAEDKEEHDEEKEEHEEKKAGMNGLYSAFFPDDDLDTVKTAEEEKLAAIEETMGADAYDTFASRFDLRIEKLASDLLAGQIPNDKAHKDEHGGKLDTKSTHVQDEVKAKNEASSVGHYQQKHAMDAAMRKALILSRLAD
jgi:hypothetical protein